MAIKFYFTLAAALILLAGGYYLVDQIQENAVLKDSLKSATDTIKHQINERDKLNKLTVQTLQQREDLNNELESTKRKLSKLKTTKQQLDCDLVALPAGYVEWLLQPSGEGENREGPGP